MSELTSISHVFDKDNEWAGYEFIEKVSQHHTMIIRYNNSGELVATKHIFDDIPEGGTVESFVQYMTARKSTAKNENFHRAQEMMSARRIDMNPSISDAKMMRKID